MSELKVKNVFKHLKTICTHKYYVGKVCFKFGLYKQGILHDLSKFSPIEFWTSVKYYQGTSSPIDAEKEHKGYSDAWLHHFHRNKHHWAFWIDFNRNQEMVAYRMPYKYALEAVADWIGAGITYSKSNIKDYDWSQPYNYYKKNIRPNGDKNFNYQTRQLWDTILVDLMNNGLDWVCNNIKLGTYENIYKTTKLDKSEYAIYNVNKYAKLLYEYYREDKTDDK